MNLNVDQSIALPVFLWLYAVLMVVMMRWLPQRLEKWLFGKPTSSPVQRYALKVKAVIEVEDLDR
jgi:hypothetical protein